jgi:hypothetical protein
MPRKTLIQHRRDTQSNWTAVNPVLAVGEFGVESDTNRFKIGDGSTDWTNLAYQGSSSGALPAGGLAGQLLAKIDDTDYNTFWVDNPSEQTLYLVRNNTGSTILKGTLVSATGAEPSGRIDVAPHETTGLQDSELRVMGMATANISNGVNGTVISFGTLKNIDTRGSVASALAVGDETWAEGDILFAHPTVAGKLTKVRPQHDLAVAFITVRHASTGQIAVRIIPGNNHLEWMHDVAMTDPQDNDILVYDSTTEVWKNQQLSQTTGIAFSSSHSGTTWNVVHNLGYRPSVTTTDNALTPNVVEGTVVHIDANSLTVTFTTSVGGTVYLS